MMSYPQNSVPNPYMYNNAVVPQTYSCVCVPHLDSIAMQTVNVYCNPSQDTGGKDLPGNVKYKYKWVVYVKVFLVLLN